ncbi:MAG: hypothetical protein A2021_02230 [Elusimicrobia bacterium GWF2_52_66]|nr:MAG: hypothetical protein A2X33_03450 [Elusimicrobia bacterium GWA2_51_34]OGR87968.1 MAG: hypothetical protein A2021_02230 [Elusimicrobia bacterium GWF2_52_66]HAF94669.1 hypothetical protein [Elusimicrobiota bacterium]HCE99147.1 hypothetical protein [Elusimicrobiota bacterium]
MKIAILNLTGGGISGGHKSYIANIIPRLAASDKIERILCASPVSFKAETWIPASPKLALAVCEPFRFFSSAPDSKFKVVLNAFRPDVVFVTMERHINYPGAPIVTIVHNMAPFVSITTTSGLREKIKSLARRFDTGLAVNRASAVIAPTAFVRNALLDRFGVEREKITLINFGHTPKASAKPPTGEIKQLLSSGFIFTAGSFEVYRGYEDLLVAFAEVKKSFPNIKMAIAGVVRSATLGYKMKMQSLAASLGLLNDVLWLGYIPHEELGWYYSHCSAFALTSRVESFCFVALEALAHGCNCISTDSPCLPEIMADASLYYKAGDAKGLGRGLLEILARDNSARERALQRAMGRAAEFSWDKAARETIDVFLKAAGSGG